MSVFDIIRPANPYKNRADERRLKNYLDGRLQGVAQFIFLLIALILVFPVFVYTFLHWSEDLTVHKVLVLSGPSLFQTFLSVVASVVAALAVIAYFGRIDKDIVKELEEYAPIDFYKQSLADFVSYQGVYRRDHRVSCILRRPSDADNDRRIYFVDFEVSYEQSHIDEGCLLKVFRNNPQNLRNGLDNPIELEWTRRGKMKEIINNEFCHFADESDFPSEANITEDDYEISDFRINDELQSLEKTVDEAGNITYRADNSIVSINAKVNFVFTMPVELNGFAESTSDYVTYRSFFEFDFSRVEDEVEIWVVAHAGIKDDEVSNDRTAILGISKRHIPGWSLPRSGWVAIWWQK